MIEIVNQIIRGLHTNKKQFNGYYPIPQQRRVNVSNMNCLLVEQRSIALKMLHDMMYDRNILNNLLRDDSEFGMKVIGIIQESLPAESFQNEVDIVSCRAFLKWIFGKSINLPELTVVREKSILGLHSSIQY